MTRRGILIGRREFLLAPGTLALVGTLGNADAQGKALDDGVATATIFGISNGESVADLAAAARQCVTTAANCIDHFTNDPGLDAQDSHLCMQLDEAVIAVCGAVASLASIESPYLTSIVVTAMEICKACEIECEARKDRHPCVVDCANACRRFIDSCNRATVNVEYHL